MYLQYGKQKRVKVHNVSSITQICLPIINKQRFQQEDFGNMPYNLGKNTRVNDVFVDEVWEDYEQSLHVFAIWKTNTCESSQ